MLWGAEHHVASEPFCLTMQGDLGEDRHPAVTMRGAIHGGSRGAPVASTHWVGLKNHPDM